MLRAYKRSEPGSPLVYTRLEMEVKGSKAQQILGLLVYDLGDWGKASMGHIRDLIDFKTEWWGEFIGAAERAFCKIGSYSKRKIDQVKKWLYKQVSASFAMVCQVDDSPLTFMRELLEMGQGKLRPKHLTIIQSCSV